MATVADAARLLADYAPLELAEEWDNVGLLVGDPSAGLERLMTCLTIAPEVVEEAVRRGVDLVVAHHPLPFRPLNRLTPATPAGAMLWRLAGAGVAVYSAHTAYDSAAGGVNDQLAELLGLARPAPFAPSDRVDGAGVGRVGDLASPASLPEFADRAKRALGSPTTRIAGDGGRPVARVAVACGSGGSLIDAAIGAGADTLLTGEATLHDCLKCETLGIGLVLVGHYASERFAMDALAGRLAGDLGGVEVWASEAEADPLRAV